MRYTNQLHNSSRRNVLKNRSRKSIMTSFLWLGIIATILLMTVNFSKLDPSSFFIGFLVSLVRVLIAYIIALILSVIFALLISINEKVEAVMLPFFDVMQSFPSFALFPAMIAAIHSSEIIIISVLTITIIWPILLTIIGSIKNRREDLEEAATIFGAKGLNRLIHFTLPALSPSIVTGSIVGWGEGWEFIIGAELLVHANSGIGKYLGFLGSNNDDLLLALGIFILMVLLFVINKLVWLPLLSLTTRYQSE